MHRAAAHIACFLAVAAPMAAAAAPDPQVLALEQQVTALQVDHALALTAPQAQALLPVLQGGRSQLQTFEAQRQAAQPALVAALTQAVTDLQASGAISSSTAQALAAARPPPPDRSALASASQQISQILTSAQQQALQSVQVGQGPGHRGHGPGPGGHDGPFRFHVLFSDAFIALVQARAG